MSLVLRERDFLLCLEVRLRLSHGSGFHPGKAKPLLGSVTVFNNFLKRSQKQKKKDIAVHDNHSLVLQGPCTSLAGMYLLPFKAACAGCCQKRREISAVVWKSAISPSSSNNGSNASTLQIRSAAFMPSQLKNSCSYFAHLLGNQGLALESGILGKTPRQELNASVLEFTIKRKPKLRTWT